MSGTALLLVDGTVRISAIVGAALGAAWLLRRRSAAARHFVLASAIAAAALVPALRLVVPAWQLAGSPADIAAVPAPDTTVAATTAPAASAATPPARTAVARAAPASIVSRLLVPVWLAGASLSLLVLLIGFARLAWLASRSAVVTSGPWARLARELSQEAGLRAPVTVLQSAHPALLVAWGIRRPTIILPAPAPGWSIDRMRVVLHHELAHIQRHDWVTQLAAELLRAAGWFNPLLWIACRRLRLESERACDDAVMERGVAAADYATHLMDLARTLGSPRGTQLPGWPAPAMARPSSLRMRITAMLDATRNRQPLSRIARFAILVVVVGFSALAASAQTSLATMWGTVADQNGGLVPNAKVTLADTQSTRKYEVTSDATGRYEFIGLPAGDYRLRALVPGFQVIDQTVTIAAGAGLQQNVELHVGSLEETMTVVGGTPAVDTASRTALTRKAPTAQRTCTPSALGGNIKAPARLLDVRPQYPANLQNSGIEGVVVLKGTIGTDGAFRELEPVEPAQPDLAQAAVDAVRQWTFTPTLLNCVAVEVPIKVMVKFSMP